MNITTVHNVGDTVYHLNPSKGIRRAIVKKIMVSIVLTSTEIVYTIVYEDQSVGSTLDVLETTLFADPDQAWNEYKQVILEL